uniref:Uncharacterized protein n=1 Tax=Oryza punctata TaxID=4537 RepID=A0A0E0MJX0_ORYPU
MNKSRKKRASSAVQNVINVSIDSEMFKKWDMVISTGDSSREHPTERRSARGGAGAASDGLAARQIIHSFNIGITH